MPYKTQWYVKGQVAYTQFWGEPTVEELRAALVEYKNLIEQSEHALVHQVVDFGRLSKPLHLTDLPKAFAGYKPHRRTGWVISIREKDSALKFLTNIGRQLLGLRQRSFKTIEEARQYLKFVDSTVDWNTADESVVAEALQQQA